MSRDRKFRYVPACATDIRKTFARVRRALRAEQAAQRTPEGPVQLANVQRLKRRG